jgi:hypothetical protein
MEKEFIPYEQALALKELGFDEPCFGYYIGLGDNKETPFKLIQIQSEKEQFNWVDNVCHAPLYQQAFRWFREKYGYLPNIHDFNGNFKATLSGNCNWLGSWTKTYEEAELECLKKLIEIVK